MKNYIEKLSLRKVVLLSNTVCRKIYKKGSIIISSIDGVSKKVLSINRKTDEVVITTIGLKPGVYIVSLFSEDIIVESKKLSIVK